MCQNCLHTTYDAEIVFGHINSSTAALNWEVSQDNVCQGNYSFIFFLAPIFFSVQRGRNNTNSFQCNDTILSVSTAQKLLQFFIYLFGQTKVYLESFKLQILMYLNNIMGINHLPYKCKESWPIKVSSIGQIKQSFYSFCLLCPLLNPIFLTQCIVLLLPQWHENASQLIYQRQGNQNCALP